MKTCNKSPTGLKMKAGGVALVLAMSSLLFSVAAQANTSAGTIIRNSVSVAYKDTGGAAQTAATDTVDVTVDLVPAVSWGTAPADQTVGSATALPSTYALTLTNAGNGADTYTITDNTVESCVGGTSALAAENFGFVSTSISLGGTVTTAVGVYAAPNTTISVSNLVSGAGGFQAGDLVMVGSIGPFTVVSATNNASPATDVLVVADLGAAIDASLAGGATGAGVQIGERQTVTYANTGISGVLSGSGGLCEHQHELTATGTLATGGNTDVVEATGADYFTTLVRGVTLSVVKYVRNVTNTGKTGAGAFVYDTNTYYTSGVSGNPGDTLEYLVVSTNTSVVGATDVVFTDTLPLFTTYTPSTLLVDADGSGTMDAVIVGDTEVDVVAGGVIGLTGGVATVYAGVGGSETTTTGGTVAASPAYTAILYQLTID